MQYQEAKFVILRQYLDYGQDAFARLLNMSRSNLSSLETERIKPTVQTLIRVCVGFGISAELLVKGNVQDLITQVQAFKSKETIISRLTDLTESEVQKYSDKIGERTKLSRKAKGLSQKQLAQSLNLSQSSISEIEKGKTLPSVDQLVALSETLETTIDYLLLGIPGKGTEALVMAVQRRREEFPEEDENDFLKLIATLKRIWGNANEKEKKWIRKQVEEVFPVFIGEPEDR
ncbi:helix-turn-helix domain-containing protein [Aneurinibacillus danicus]|uniref:HTH cro/C1-type domain-containing protein n=1 Tax=Aneurinibacillus danicus TaxID=267746 RepID=A0A511VA12_9BACL|nr:helix-turn-helix domain-containing protein [Aneurinibacillus danicus]GEN35111.1 hypothetical protein ADA01nite_25710 [Aneurinibacillus danicus]